MSDPVTTGGMATRPQGAAEPVAEAAGAARGLWSDALHDLVRRPLFLIAFAIVGVFVVMAAFPSLFTSVNPEFADLSRSMERPSAEAWFGYDLQGRDVYARTIYGARPSIVVGVLAVIAATLFGGLIGILAGYFGGWIDSLLSRMGEIFLGLPYVLGAIIILSIFAGPRSGASATQIMFIVVLVMAFLGWPLIARIARSSVLAVRHSDYVQAARGLGAGPARVIFRHLLPNALAPIIVMATISIGAYISAEAVLSFLGIGLRAPVISWGVAIADHQSLLRQSAHPLLFPAAFLTIAVLAFVMIGDAVREALDPKLR
ncbi:MAG: ABC transporter permease subunit [Actinophytocola sp.]|nr:ABC transporter permease subunit [Actinophytocola sp.]